MTEKTRIKIGRYDPLITMPRGISYRRFEQRMYLNDIAVVDDSPGNVLEKLFPIYRIFGFREFDFSRLGFNHQSFTGLILESAPENANSMEIYRIFIPPSLRSVKRKPGARTQERLERESRSIVKYISDWSPNGPITNPQIYTAITDVLNSLSPYLQNPRTQKYVEKAEKLIRK
jgi:hypothetical protein